MTIKKWIGYSFLALLGVFSIAAYAADIRIPIAAGMEARLRVTDNGDGTVTLQTVSAGGSASTGGGATDATTTRVVIATDSPGVLATGTAGTPASQVVSVQGIAGGTPLPTTASQSSQYPLGAVATAAVSGNVAAGTATATLAATASVTNYISGFDITSSGATAASVVTCTVTNIIGGVTLSYTLAVVAGVTAANNPVSVRFNPALPASASNTAIAVSCPTLGAGNTNTTVNAYGYRL